jgi:hypothetical protein
VGYDSLMRRNRVLHSLAIGIIVGTGMFLFVPIVAGQWQLLVAIVAGVGAALVTLFID